MALQYVKFNLIAIPFQQRLKCLEQILEELPRTLLPSSTTAPDFSSSSSGVQSWVRLFLITSLPRPTLGKSLDSMAEAQAQA